MQDYFAKLAQVESGGNPFAQNPNSSAKGMFQFVDGTARQYGITAPFGTKEYAQQEIEAVKKFTEDNKRALTATLGREPTQGELYLAHQQGAGGAAKILANPDKPVTELVGNDEALLNAATPEMTAGEFAQKWTSKFDDLQGSAQQETFSVELPDGTVIEDIPLGTTKEQIKAKLEAGGYDISKLEPQPPSDPSFVDRAMAGDIQAGEAPDALTQPEPEKRQAGFVQRVGEAYSDRLGNVGESIQNYDDQYLLETGAQAAGQGLGFVGDVLGNALISGYRYLPESDYGLGEGAALVGSIPTGGDKDLKDRALGGLKYATNEWREFKAENPRAARNLGAAGNIGAALLPLKGANVAGKTGKGVGRAMQGTAKVLDKMIPSPQDMTADIVKSQASQYYKLADELGGTISPKTTSNIYKNIVNKIEVEGGSLPKNTQAALRKVADPEGVVRQATDVFKTLDGQPLTLEGFQAIDKTLGGLAWKAGTPDDVSRKVLMMQKELRNAVENMKPENLVGGKAGFDAYKKATAIWAKQSRMADLEYMTARAFTTQQPVTTLKASLGRFLADKDNLKGFNAAEIKAIQDVVKTNVLSETFRTLSSRLPATIGVAVNPALAPAMAAGSSVVRTAREALMLRRMQEINNLIATGDKGRRGTMNSILQGGADALGKGGEFIEKAYSGGKGNLATLGTLQQLQQEQQRNQQ
jgi:hypothetical protein